MVREEPDEGWDADGSGSERRADSRTRRVGPSRERRRERGQTTLDFTVGVTLFLLVVALVFLFVPGMLQPFTEGGQEDIVSANRVADSLTQGALTDPRTPHVLDPECTVRLFNRSYSPDCRYPDSSLNAQLGLSANAFVNVSIRGNVSAGGADELLCWDQTDDKLTTRGGDCDDLLATGDTPPRNTQSSVTARRVVEINDTDVSLIVRVW